jgi:L-glutamine-phosphate cytidylyltransferase
VRAVLLAAGYTTRLSPSLEDVPKTLLPVAGVPILRRAITSLVHLGFDHFVICTGHLEQLVHSRVAEWFPQLDITFVTNPAFRTTHNASSLWLAREHLEGESFLLLDGDVVFDRRVVEELIERGPDCIAVRSVGEIGLEEVKVTADVEDRVLAIGKHVPVRSAMGESVGIGWFSALVSNRLFAALRERIGQQGMVGEYYEAALQQVIDQGSTIYGVDIGTMYATEIDTIDDLHAAETRLAELPAFDTRVDFRLAI